MNLRKFIGNREIGGKMFESAVIIFEGIPARSLRKCSKCEGSAELLMEIMIMNFGQNVRISVYLL